jgi:predicted helicase
MPCGTGKTLIGIWTFLRLKAKSIFIVVLSLFLLSQLYEDWLIEMYSNKNKLFELYGKELIYSFFLIGSDVDIDKKKLSVFVIEYPLRNNNDEIVEYLKNTNIDFKIVITTYQSSKYLLEAIVKTEFVFDLGIYDEAHRTVGTKEENSFNYLLDDKVYKVSNKKLFLTATPKYYKLEKNRQTNECKIKHFSMDNDSVYGKVIYQYSTRMAINDEQLVDYKIIVPVTNTSLYKDVIKAISINIDNNKYETSLILSSLMILESFLNINNDYNFSHMIVFCNKSKNGIKLEELIKLLIENEEKYKILSDLYIKYIDSNNTSGMRSKKKIIKEYEKKEKGILINIRLFGEGVDIKKCDAIFFLNNKKSTIDIIQNIGRCLRKCKSKPHKKGHIFLPYLITEGITNIFKDSKLNLIMEILKLISYTDDTPSQTIYEKIIVNNGLETFKSNNNTKNINYSIDGISNSIDFTQIKNEILIKSFSKKGNIDDTLKKNILVSKYNKDKEFLNEIFVVKKIVRNIINYNKIRMEYYKISLDPHPDIKYSSINFCWDNYLSKEIINYPLVENFKDCFFEVIKLKKVGRDRDEKCLYMYNSQKISYYEELYKWVIKKNDYFPLDYKKYYNKSMKELLEFS